MFLTFLLYLGLFATGLAVMRKFPKDQCLNALADLTELPIKLAWDFLKKKPELPMLGVEINNPSSDEGAVLTKEPPKQVKAKP